MASAPFPLFRNHGRIAPENNTGSTQEAMHRLALDLDEAGWGVEYAQPYARIEMLQPMDSFSGGAFGRSAFWGVFPPDYQDEEHGGVAGDLRKIPMIVDELPFDGWVPEDPFFVAAVTHTTDPTIVHGHVVNLMLGWAPQPSGKLPFSDPDKDPLTHTYIYHAFPTSWLPGRAPVSNNVPFGRPGLALNTGSGAANMANGGYRFSTPGINFQIRMNSDGNQYFQATLEKVDISEPAEERSRYFTDPDERLAFFDLRLDAADWQIAAGFGYCFIATVGNELPGAEGTHLEAANIFVPVDSGTEPVIASFLVGGNDAKSSELTFEKGPQCSGLMRLQLDGAWLTKNNGGGGGAGYEPRVMTIFSPPTGGGDTGRPLRWESGVVHLSEARVSFNVKTLPNKPASVLGRIPNCLVGHAKLATCPDFKWDGRGYRLFTHMSADSAASGTLFFQIGAAEQDALEDPKCSGDV